MYKHILIPIDGSKHADNALDMAIELSKHLNVKPDLSVVHVIPKIPLDTPLIALNIDLETDEETETLTRNITLKLQETKLPYRVVTKHGSPSKVICQTAKDVDADLIIMGTRGINLLSQVLLGSVSSDVIKHAHCPVMTVKD